ncbi:hypothetical protein [Priestia taiwanensis]|uniref:Uncharacterized protein n=1 Tax=Priestia taiwanensis TaxID=1347902 RepID=A0A917AKI1_9BACI|nr:hypothetical protein [Priestia taiwanensis]MBM7361830.1 hypothetical protein [Priestia taiwanensis]GGE57289.1 hypothetical protein GCM10007140_04550 [Priestia taiwanensis]
MDDKLHCIAVYQMNDYFVVRKCCDSSYRWHALEGGAAMRLPQCNCEIVASKLTKDEAMKMGADLSREYDVSLVSE